MDDIVAVGARCCLALVFLLSGASKLRRADFAAFRTSVAALLPRWGRQVRPLPRAVVALELAVPLLLFVPGLLRWGFALATALLLAFAAAIVAARARGVNAPCRCFGGSGAALGVRHVVRNALLAAAGLVGLLSGPASGDLPAAAVAVAAFVGLTVGVVFAALDDIVDAFAPRSTAVEHLE